MSSRIWCDPRSITMSHKAVIDKLLSAAGSERTSRIILTAYFTGHRGGVGAPCRPRLVTTPPQPRRGDHDSPGPGEWFLLRVGSIKLHSDSWSSDATSRNPRGTPTLDRALHDPRGRGRRALRSWLAVVCSSPPVGTAGFCRTVGREWTGQGDFPWGEDLLSGWPDLGHFGPADPTSRHRAAHQLGKLAEQFVDRHLALPRDRKPWRVPGRGRGFLKCVRKKWARRPPHRRVETISIEAAPGPGPREGRRLPASGDRYQSARLELDRPEPGTRSGSRSQQRAARRLTAGGRPVALPSRGRGASAVDRPRPLQSGEAAEPRRPVRLMVFSRVMSRPWSCAPFGHLCPFGRGSSAGAETALGGSIERFATGLAGVAPAADRRTGRPGVIGVLHPSVDDGSTGRPTRQFQGEARIGARATITRSALPSREPDPSGGRPFPSGGRRDRHPPSERT